MIPLSREEQLCRWRSRYARRNKQGKAQLLDELCEQYGYSRKHAIKLLADSLPKPTGQLPSGSPPRYAPITEVVTHIWRAAEQLCGKRLVAALPLWLPHYAKHFNSLLPCQRKLLNEVSAATLDRLLRPQRARESATVCVPPSPAACCAPTCRCKAKSGMSGASASWKPTVSPTAARVWPATSLGV